jgi:nucleotidyltransferase substrate binding protein (TIGR01987 family)
MDDDVRWKQRLANYGKALERLGEAVRLSGQRQFSDLENQGLIQAFESSHEPACKLTKDWLQYQGTAEITGSRYATGEAFRVGLIRDGETWMEMIKSRNRSSHAYNLETAHLVVSAILDRYWHAFRQFHDTMNKRAAGS